MRKQPSTQPIEQKQLMAATNIALALATKNSQELSKLKPRKKGQKSNVPKAKKLNKFAHVSKVPECTVHYASAICDPEFTPSGACVPSGFPIPSQKIKSFARGTFVCGTTGQGYIVCNSNLTNNNAACTFTAVTSVGTSATALSAFTNLSTSVIPGMPFSNAQLASVTDQISGRFVAACLKARYSGTEANRNGIVTTFEEPDHVTLSGMSMDQINGSLQSYRERPKPDGSWHQVNWSGPVSPLEITWVKTPTQNGSNCMGIIVDGIAGDKYEWEFYEHAEFSGKAVNALSSSHVDQESYGKAVEAFKNVSGSEPLNGQNARSSFGSFLLSMGSSIAELARFGIPMLANMISPALGPISRAVIDTVSPRRLQLTG
jgi:hypothetical protein